MNKADLVGQVAGITGMTKKDTDPIVSALLATVQAALKTGDKVQLVGFGTFEVRNRAARKGRNPQTGKDIQIPASRIPAFKPGKVLKDSVH
ncbi:MAG: HU family DNA-binding protein [Methylocystaceae bacterium]